MMNGMSLVDILSLAMRKYFSGFIQPFGLYLDSQWFMSNTIFYENKQPHCKHNFKPKMLFRTAEER